MFTCSPTRSTCRLSVPTPTGLTAAASLAAKGRGVIVADSRAEGQNTSRASVVYPRTLELLDLYGIAEPLAARGIPRPAVH
jgi:2-polyprenyl-6-methoxyphenol hydroxylase-like FAD-dependent oxidoreductase